MPKTLSKTKRAELISLLKTAVSLREQEWDAERDFEIELGRDIDGLSDIIDDLAVCGPDGVDDETLDGILDEFDDSDDSEQGSALTPVIAILTAFTVAAVLVAQSGLLHTICARLAEVIR
jgi:hypothetical protein